MIQRRPRQSRLKDLVNLGSCRSCRKSMYASTEHLEMSCFCCTAQSQGIPEVHAEAITSCACTVCYKHGSWCQTGSFKCFEISVLPLKMYFRQIWAPRLWTICSRAGQVMEGAGRKAPECQAQRGSRGKWSLPELAFNSCVEKGLGWEWLFDPTTSSTALTNGIALQQCMRWHSFPHRQYLHSNNNSTASAVTVAGSIQVADPFQPSPTGNRICHCLSKASLFS